MAVEETAVLLLVAGGVLLFLLSVACYRRWRYGYWPCIDWLWREECDDDDDDDESEGGKTDAEQIALIPTMHRGSVGDGDGKALLTRQPVRSYATWLTPFWRRRSSTIDSRTHLKAAVSKKIHKPYFYPLLDETVQWWQGWEDQQKVVAANSVLPASPRRSGNQDGSDDIALPNVPEQLIDISIASS